MALALAQHPGTTGWLEKWPLLMQLRADLETSLGSEAFAVIWERGQASDLQTVVQSLIERFDKNGNVEIDGDEREELRSFVRASGWVPGHLNNSF